MADIVVENRWDWAFDAKDRWYFYKDDYFTQYNWKDEFAFFNAPEFHILGKNFTYVKAGTNNNGEQQYELAGGTVTGFFFGNKAAHTYISDIDISAAKLGSLMEKGTSAASAKIFSLILDGDDDVTLGFGSDRMETFGGDDVIRGRAGNDWIKADGGDDILYGGTGKDTLFGGSGHDTFVFDTKAGPKNVDVISDFSNKSDMIAIDHLVYRGIGSVGDLDDDAFQINRTGKAEDRSDRVIYNEKTGDLFFDADGNGSGAEVKFAHITAGLKLTEANFDLI
jgi:Ca2+-binding RTX toxin-like protein